MEYTLQRKWRKGRREERGRRREAGGVVTEVRRKRKQIGDGESARLHVSTAGHLARFAATEESCTRQDTANAVKLFAKRHSGLRTDRFEHQAGRQATALSQEEVRNPEFERLTVISYFSRG